MIQKLKKIFQDNRFLIFIFIIIIVVDKWTKLWVKHIYTYGETRKVIGDFFKLTFIENEGIAFGLFSSWVHPLKSILLLLLSILALIFIIGVYKKTKKTTFVQISFGLILGGAFGNIYDRLVYKKVIDFFNFGIGHHRWPFFNIADSAITVGVILIMIMTFIKKEEL